MTEVVLLGTGAADGWPNPFCACASCESARRRGELRGPTAALVDDVVLLDCGPEAARAAGRAGRRLDRVHTVLITHAHPDHCDPAFLLWRSWSGLRTPLLVAGPPAVLDRCREWIGPDDPVELREVTAGDAFPAGEHRVRAVAADHQPGAVLYELTGPDGARLLYATDTGALPGPTVDALRDVRLDLILLEETYGDSGELGPGHHDLPTFGSTLERLRAVGAITAATTVVAVHLGHHNPPAPELSRRLAAVGARALPDLAVLDVVPGLGATPRDRPARAARRTLVTGGARSGKSAAAERLVADRADVTYVATAPRYDDAEWSARVAAHRARRPPSWRTVELAGPSELAPLLLGAAEDDVLLVDCLTLWATTAVDEHDAWDDPARRAAVEADVAALLDAWRATAARVVLVTNEVGSGIVPATSAGRHLRDLLGTLNAALARDADEALLVVAGRTIRL